MSHSISPNLIEKINRSNELLKAKTKEIDDLESDTRKLQKSIEKIQEQIECISAEKDVPATANRKLLDKQQRKTAKLKARKEEAYKWSKCHDQMLSQLCMLENSIKCEQIRLDTEIKRTANEQASVMEKLSELECQEERYLKMVLGAPDDAPTGIGNPAFDLLSFFKFVKPPGKAFAKPTPMQNNFLKTLFTLRNLKSSLELQICDLEEEMRKLHEQK